jgi:hypothetical protein
MPLHLPFREGQSAAPYLSEIAEECVSQVRRLQDEERLGGVGGRRCDRARPAEVGAASPRPTPVAIATNAKSAASLSLHLSSCRTWRSRSSAIGSMRSATAARTKPRRMYGVELVCS